MDTREASPDDNQPLQELQARCPQGTTLVVSLVNTPDFFARVKAYPTYRVYVTCEDDRIIGSGAVAVRDGMLDGRPCRVGYEFQAFVAPEARRKGVAGALHRCREQYLIEQGAALSYALTLEGNSPAMAHLEYEGFVGPHRTLVMPILHVYREMSVPPTAKIRSAERGDLPAVAELMNHTWRGCDLYEPTSAERLAAFIERTPAYTLDDLLVLESGGKVVACLGCWDWSAIIRVSVEALNWRLRMTRVMTDVMRWFRPTPMVPRIGATLKQGCLTPIGFAAVEHLVPLLRYVNNRALARGIEQLLWLWEPSHPLLRCLKGFFRTDVAMCLYVKPFGDSTLGGSPVFVDAIDL
ncbi:MAG TPA: GNAT family N-acetyltransferase [Phycisphaerae bacterium]|nr:GNAT family N-acetyltransferase [Phycisphaerae bacterium]